VTAGRRLVGTIALLVAVVPGPGATAADVLVAGHGDDAADGAPDRPVASLRRAFDLVRDLRAARGEPDRPLVIEVGAGRHELTDTLRLGPDDSGTVRSPTIVRAAVGARPVISGGRRVDGWEKVAGGGRWEARLPAAGGAWNFSQLFVNGQRRFRPMLPAAGWHSIAAAAEPSPTAVGKGYDRFTISADELRDEWAGSDVEVVAVHRWTMSRMRIARIDPAARPDGVGPEGSRTVTFTGHTASPGDWNAFPRGHRFLVENVREALGAPGSWHLDRPAGVLTYCPHPDERPDAAEVIAPHLDRLVVLAGDAAAGRYVEHVRFEGITFAHGNWTVAAAGHSHPQADIDVGAAITATAARHVAFSDCRVRHVGRYAFEFAAGCRGCSVERCDLADLGGGGVLIGTSGGPGSWGDAPLPGGDVAEIAVRDSTIRHGGRLHAAAVGVWIGHADHCTVEHCDIHDLTYTGVSVGWCWGYAPSGAHHNRIAFNRLHHLGQGVLSDMGGVYTLGVSPGTVVEGNVIHDIVSHDYGGWGLYTDEGSTGIVMRNNLVSRTSSGGFHQHYGRDNVIENNVFAGARDWQLQRSKVEPHTSFTFARNVVWWDGDVPLVNGDWSNGVVTRNNCYWHAGKPVAFPDARDLAARQASGADEGSIVADPRFADPGRGDFTPAEDSPVWNLGFEPLAPDRAGPRVTPPAGDLAPVPTIWPEAQRR